MTSLWSILSLTGLLADALNRSNLDFADRQEFHHKLLDQSAD